ncbi:hypothetical protein, partial [Thiolapillus sp.]|uniref:hypothetical protein n=2 Tax=Thiolapillus sp. TaxID=2017437 RepID=UPI002739AC43
MSWHKVKLKTLLSQPVQNGYSPVCPEEPNGKWILGLGALSDFGLDTTQIKPAPVDDSKVDNFLLRPGDFLVSRSNTRDKVGRSALFKGEIKNCSYPDLMMRFRINETTIYPEFLEMVPRRFKWNSSKNLCQYSAKYWHEEKTWTATRYCYWDWG